MTDHVPATSGFASDDGLFYAMCSCGWVVVVQKHEAAGRKEMVERAGHRIGWHRSDIFLASDEHKETP